MDAKHSLGEPRCLISRSSLLHNAAVVRRAVGPRVKVCAIVKADAYGHGAAQVVDALCNYSTDEWEAPLVDAVAVADLDEAAALGDAPTPVLVLRPVENAYLGRQRPRLEMAVQRGWTLTVCTPAAADDLARIAVACGQRANVQVMLDTGMRRAGVEAGEFDELLRKIHSSSSLRLTGIYTHFACGEIPGHPFTSDQLSRFLTLTEATVRAGRPVRHAANSGAIFGHPASHLDMVRPGISLYGIDPLCRPCMDRPLRPAMKWSAPLVGIRDVPAGATVGYGQDFTAAVPTRVGLVPVGYADGYLRRFSGRGVVIVHGRPAPVIGRVSMDFTTIDLTRVPHPSIGDEITLLDPDPLSPASVYKLAEWGETIPYEILCRIGPRVKRVMVESTENADRVEPALAAPRRITPDT